MSMMKEVLFDIVEDYTNGKSTDLIIDKLIDQYELDFDCAVELYEQAVLFASQG